MINYAKTSTPKKRKRNISGDTEPSPVFLYNVDGQRISKIVNGTETEFFYNGSILAGQKTGNNTLVFMYDNNGDIFGMVYNGTPYYYIKNAQNDVVAIVDSNKNVIAEYQYDAWGRIVSVTDVEGNDISAQKDHIGNVNPIRYRSYYYDNETGLYYLNSRYYSPELCRFLNADAFTQTGQGLLDKNKFAYCGNNPVNRVDETGYGWRDIWNGIKSFLSSIFGWSSSIETTSNENCVPYLPDPLPVTLEMTEKQTVTKPKSGDSSKPITAFLKTNTKHPIKSSTVGIKVNIAKLSFTTDLGLDNFGSSVSFTIGDTTYGFRKRGDITRLKIGYEFSAETQIGEDVKDGVYTNVSLSGWFLLMAYAYATTGSPAPSSQYSYAN